MSHPSPLPSPSAIPAATTPSPSRNSLDVPRPVYGHGQGQGGGHGYFSPQSSSDSLRPPSYSSQWLGMDSRASSTQSLVPAKQNDADLRRRLLVIYVHGFYGNDQSFRSFPAHVHSFLHAALSESHVVHTKIYPKYKTYKSVDLARDNFSQWLQPHENDRTDTILIGHSMGGLLIADVVLMLNTSPYSRYPFKHRILGTISLDSPFLGLHPGIVVAGISSLFRPSPSPTPAAESAQSPLQQSQSSLSIASNDLSLQPSVSPSTELTSWASASSVSPAAADPTFNPPFFNDVVLRQRTFVSGLVHFAKKHKQSGENIINAATNHIVSHLEFGGILADYAALHSRYNKIRSLEDVDDLGGNQHSNAASQPEKVRVRFANYYTASTGRIKPAKTGSAQMSRSEGRRSDSGGSGAGTPRISIDDRSGGGEQPKLKDLIAEEELRAQLERASMSDSESQGKQGAAHRPSTASTSRSGAAEHEALTVLEPQSMVSSERDAGPTVAAPEIAAPVDTDLPPIPDPPEKPTEPDLDAIKDPDVRKQVEKETKRLRKEYERAVKERDKAVKARQKFLDKQKKKAEQAVQKREKEEHKEALKREKEILKEAQRHEREVQKLEKEEERRRLREKWGREKVDDYDDNDDDGDGDEGDEQTPGTRDIRSGSGRGKKEKEKEEKPPKDRKFCTLPRKSGGVRDAAWIRVQMEGFDEVGAHCGLFVPGPHYERLVGDVGQRIVDWVGEDMTRRAIRDMA